MERIEITNKSVAKVYVYTGEYDIKVISCGGAAA